MNRGRKWALAVAGILVGLATVASFLYLWALPRPHPVIAVSAAMVCIVSFVGFVTLGLPARLKKEAGQPIPEADFWRPPTLLRFLGTLGDSGIDDYRRELRVDRFFALIYGTALAILLGATWSWAFPSWYPRWIFLFPAAMILADLIEDGLILFTSEDKSHSPNPRDGEVSTGRVTEARWLPWIAAGATAVKWTFALLTLELVIAALTRLFFLGPA